MVNRGIGSASDIRKKLSFNHELILTCYHEAGHTIAGLLNYLIISSVGIELSDKKKTTDSGYTHFDYILDPEQTISYELNYKLLMSELKLNYGGLAAETIFYKDFCGSDKLPMVLKFGSYVDRDRVAEIIVKNNLAPPGKKRYAFKKKVFEQTRRALEDNWTDVKLVSHALFAKRKLYYTDLKELLLKKSDNKQFWKDQFKIIEILADASKLNDEEIVKKYL